ncbi:MAG: Fic family protein [Bdellovibrionota bacterium]
MKLGFSIKARLTCLAIAALLSLPSWATEANVGSTQQCLLRTLRTLLSELPDPARVEYRQFSTHAISADRAKVLEVAKAQLREKDYRAFEEFYLSHFFFDRNEIVQSRFQIGRSGLSVPEIFNKKGEYPFDGYLEARRFLFDRPADQLGLDDIRAVHRKLLSKDSIMPEHRRGKWEILKNKPANSEGASDAILGEIRNVRIGYNDSGKSAAAHAIKTTDGQELTSAKIAYAEINDEYTMLLKEDSQNFVEYTPLSKWRRYENDLPADLRKRLQKLQEMDTPLNTNNGAEVNAIRKEVLTVLTQKSLTRAQESLRQATNVEQQLNAIADFYQEFMSIHPFQNGNGRAGRLLVERMLESVGLPPPIWSSFGQDVVLRPSDMRLLLKDSVRLSQQYHADLKTILENGLDYRITPTVFLTPEQLAVLGAKKQKVVPEIFMVWLNYASKRKGPPKNIAEAIKEYTAWLDTLSYGKTTGSGIRLAPPSFIKTFGSLSESAEAFNFKIGTFYKQNRISRGLGLRQSPSDADIVSQFARMDGSMVGMGVSSDLSSVRGSLEKFNLTMLSDPKGFERKVYDHVEANKGYWDSGFISYTSDPGVSSDFKNGFMMGKEFRKNMKAQFEIEVLDRKVAAINNNKNTRQLSAQGYSDERETILAGGTDPESVAKVTVTDINVDPKKIGYFQGKWNQLERGQYRITRKRIAERISYNQIQLKEFDVQNKVVRTSVYQISPDGSVTKIK